MAGRPSKYEKEYCEAIIEYFDREPYTESVIIVTKKNGETYDKPTTVPCDLPLICGFAISIGVCHDTILEWSKVHPEFSLALKKAKGHQKRILVTNGMNGGYNTAFAIFTAKNIIGWSDKQEIDHKGAVPVSWVEVAKKANGKEKGE